MNKNDAINGALRWLDEATVNGAAASNGFIADYKDRMEHLLDGAVAMVESQFPIIKSVSIVQSPPKCMEGSFFPCKSFYPGEEYIFSNADAKAYSLEITGRVRMSIDGVAQTIDEDSFKRFSGLFKGSIRITSEPSGALISLNGEVLGETPVVATLRERVGNPRIFDFVAVKEGYVMERQELREFLPKDDGTVFVFPETLHFALQPQ